MRHELRLSLKNKWFEMTDPNGKTEDYREVTPYWCSRLCKIWFPSGSENPLDWFIEFKHFDHNVMTLGYPSNDDHARFKVFKHEGIEIREGREEWGAEPGKIYFVIKHGERIR